MIHKLALICLTAAAPALLAAEVPDSTVVHELNEVTVTANSARQRLDNARPGAERLELPKLMKMPAFGGERDIIRSIALLPGVNSEGDGGGGFEVRGGNASQNLVLLDGISLYNPAHVMGIFSTFNDDALGAATLYKGPIPAMFGGASSAVLETSLAPGDMERYHGSATIGLLAAKIKAEGPLVKDRLSLAVAARRSYVDAFLKMIPQYRSTVMNFYDVTARLQYRPSASHTVDGSFFIGHDNMAVGSIMGMYWGNLGASVNWQARASEKLSFTTTASFTHFDPKMAMKMMEVEQLMYTYIHNYSINERLRFEFSPAHRLDAGLRSELLRVKSAEWTFNNATERELRSLWVNSAWLDYSASIAGKIDLSLGVRLDVSTVPAGSRFHDFAAIEPKPNNFDGTTYINLQPRGAVKYSFNRCHNIKAGAGTASQNLHAIRSSTTSFPFDRYALTSARVKPENAAQYDIAYCGMTAGGEFDWSAEGFYRSISNVYDYTDGRGAFSDIALEDIILGGKGRSYGAEFMLRKNTGRLTGWLAYTLSQTRTRIPGINDGRWYNASNDRRHDFSITAIYSLSDSWSLSGAWIYSSGTPLTAPDVKYEIGGETCYYYSARNSYHTPATHRLDISATYTHTGPVFTYQWSFGLYNAYCRYNPYIIYFEDDPSKPSGTRAVQQSLYGLIPSVSYTLKF